MIGHSVPLWIVLPALAVFGAFVGRLLNKCIQQFPHHDLLRDQLRALTSTNISLGKCSCQPASTDRLPIVGWLTGFGRCHSCRRRTFREVPIVEFVTAILFAVVYWLEVPVGADASIRDTVLVPHHRLNGPEVIDLWDPIVWFHLRYALHMVMICSLIVATAIDLRYRIIPDGSTVPAITVAFAASLIFGQLFIVPIWFQDVHWVKINLLPILPESLQPWFAPWDPSEFIQRSPHWHGLLVSAAGAVVGAGSVWTVRIVGHWALKQEAMGFGDVILMGMIGSVIGWQPVLVVFMLAPTLAIFGAIINWVAHRDNEIPYGPFLSAATVILLMTWPVLWPLAKRFFDMGTFLLVTIVLMVFFLAVSLQFVQIIKRMLGISFEHDEEDEWSTGDHLMYYGQERPDEQTGQWPIPQWQGNRTGRGLKQQHDWKHGY